MVKNPADICHGPKERDTASNQWNFIAKQIKSVCHTGREVKKIKVKSIFTKINTLRKAAACYCKSVAAGIFSKCFFLLCKRPGRKVLRAPFKDFFLDKIKTVNILYLFLSVTAKTSLSLKIPAKKPEKNPKVCGS